MAVNITTKKKKKSSHGSLSSTLARIHIAVSTASLSSCPQAMQCQSLLGHSLTAFGSPTGFLLNHRACEIESLLLPQKSPSPTQTRTQSSRVCSSVFLKRDRYALPCSTVFFFYFLLTALGQGGTIIARPRYMRRMVATGNSEHCTQEQAPMLA